ncbi:MAG: helix-turn-helix domain-containing protein, partial [Planctomycetes bacterium]|nr:helix-turn-helix domain-containing protein [Planctomycetota bacterium]
MAKAFYSMEEVCELLGKSLDEVKALVQGGSLREFRDAGKIFFKAEDVDKLTGGDVSASEDSGEIMLEPAPEREPELPTSEEGEGTSFIGLEAVDEAEPTPERKGPGVSGRPTTDGIGVFDDDELEIDADPMAETQITTTTGEDQVALEGTGSGSGLLDLTREADDTSLGGILDEIYTSEGADKAKPAGVQPGGSAADIAAPTEQMISEEIA